MIVFLLSGLMTGHGQSKAIQQYYVFDERPVTATTPAGWIKEFLLRQRSGLTGHPEVLSYPFNSCLWAGVIARDNELHGDNWWRYEQTAYYSDALLKLGYLLKDSFLIQKACAGIQYTLAHPQPNGRLGPGLFASQWPIAVYFRVLQAAYNVTGDQRILNALHQHYLSYTPEEIGMKKRAIVNVEGMLWSYERTGDERLLTLAEKAWSLGGFELDLQTCLSPDTTILHGVTYMEMAKLPAILYRYTGKKIYLDAALNALQKLDRHHMLPDGVPSSNEFLAGKDPRLSHETCDISDYTWTLGYLLMITGDAAWADKLEKAVFNAGPGAVSKDFKNLQYFSSVNQVIATGNSNHNKHAFGTGWMAYWPCHETECCAGNVHRFMPNYVSRMWMKDSTGAPVAALYGPSATSFSLENGRIRGTITATTSYPFQDRILFTFDLNKSAMMPFTFRIPAWCTTPSLTINSKPYKGALTPGSFVTIRRKFSKGDRMVLHLPMTINPVLWGQWGAAIERGPLLYAYPIPEKVTIDTTTYANLHGKRSPNPDFPALDIRPAGAWNYAIDRPSTNKIRIINTVSKGYPFDPGQSPVKISLIVRKVKNWTLPDNRFTPPLPVLGQFSCEPSTDTITLVPYGATRLRLTVFPIAP